MKDTVKNNNQILCNNMTQIQEDLEVLLNHIFEQAGSKIQPEKQAEYNRAIEGTKQVFERFKSKYGCVFSSAENANNDYKVITKQ